MYSKQFNRQPTRLREGNVFSRVCYSVCPQGGPMWPQMDLFTYSLEDPPPPATSNSFPYPHGVLFKHVHLPHTHPKYVQNWQPGKAGIGLRLKGFLVCLNFDCTWNVRRLSRSHIMYERKTESDPSALNTEQYELRRVRTSADTARSASSAEWCKSTIVRNPS